MNKTSAVAVIALVIAIIGLFSHQSSPASLAGTTNYDTLYLGGTSGVTTTLAIATSTPSNRGDVVVDGTATTTVMVSSSLANTGACLQLKNSSGVMTRAYVGAAGNAFIVEAGSCK